MVKKQIKQNWKKEQKKIEKLKFKLSKLWNKLVDKDVHGNIADIIPIFYSIAFKDGAFAKQKEIIEIIDLKIVNTENSHIPTCKDKWFNPEEDNCLVCFEKQVYKELKEEIKLAKQSETKLPYRVGN